MTDQHDLESQYEEAKAAIRTREYERASGLLRQILLIDENYKDTSRLLAQTVKLRRRKWYNAPITWGTLISILMVGLLIWLVPKFSVPAALPPTATASARTLATIPPTITVIPTITAIPATAPVALVWKRISVAQDVERDTIIGFVTDPKDPDVIYASLKNAGVYKTIDGGTSWRPAHQGLQNTQAGSLLIDTQDPNTLYAATLAGIYRTKDGGESWFRIGNGNSLLMDHQNSNHLYARDANAIYESMDRGDSWIKKYSLKGECPSQLLSWAVDPESGQVLYAGTLENPCPGVYQSKDGGSSWSLFVKNRATIDMFDISMDDQGNSSVYMAHGGGIILSTYDEGKSLFDFRQCIPPIQAKPQSTEYYCAGLQGGLRIRNDKEKTTTRMGLDTNLITAIHVDENIGRILAGGTRLYQHREDGIFISTDHGLTWVKRNDGLAAARSELKIDPIDNSRLYMATYYGGQFGGNACTLYRSSDGGNHWARIRDYLEWCGPAFDGGNVMYTLEYGSLQKSWDEGETWLWNGDPSTWKKIFVGGPISANPHINGLVYSSNDKGIHYSIDGGVSWQLSKGGKALSDARYYFKDMGQTVFAIGTNEQAYSSDGGKTWEACGDTRVPSISDSRLALDVQGSQLYMATPGNGVLVSTDNCSSWQTSNDGLENHFVNTIAIDPNNPDTIYAGTDGGAYISFNAGQLWNEINDGLLGATVVYSIVVDKESNVYAATPYGIFKLEGK